MKLMNILRIFSGCLFLLTLATGFSQQSQPAEAGPGGTFSERLRSVTVDQQATQQSGGGQPVLTKFDLDFPGGTPKELIAAIQHFQCVVVHIAKGVGRERADRKGVRIDRAKRVDARHDRAVSFIQFENRSAETWIVDEPVGEHGVINRLPEITL